MHIQDVRAMGFDVAIPDWGKKALSDGPRKKGRSQEGGGGPKRKHTITLLFRYSAREARLEATIRS